MSSMLQVSVTYKTDAAA